MQKTTFPLYLNDGKALVKLSSSQKDWIAKLNQAIVKGNLILKANDCLCANKHNDDDIVVSEKDRYGLPIPQILCSHCGLIRSGLVFDEPSNVEFYKTYYRPMYSGGGVTSVFFNQIKRGNAFLYLINKHIVFSDITQVVEIGCGAGGILMPFKEKGKKVAGYDYGEEYLKYGIAKGLALYHGGHELLQEESVDLIILSHVMEHFLSPLNDLKQIIGKIRANKYILIEVPGIFHIANVYFNPILYFQNAHVFNYYYYYLKVFFENLGLKVLYGDEQCIFVCQKPENWNPEHIEHIVYDPLLHSYSQKIADYLILCEKQHKYRYFNPKWIKMNLVKVANLVGWKKIKPYIINHK